MEEWQCGGGGETEVRVEETLEDECGEVKI